VERYRISMRQPAMIGAPLNSFIGGLAVTFFFVLSGFLITSLLLREKHISGTIRIGTFLKRRALRIWPLYYTVLAGGYLLSIFAFRDTGGNPLQNGLVLNAFLFPNIAFAFGMIPEVIIQIWSVGTEEQFYLIWPFFIKHTKLFKLTRGFIILIGCWFAAGVLVHFWGDERARALIFRTRIDCMAFGGLFALAVLYGNALSGWMGWCYRVILHRMTGLAGLVMFVLLLAASWRWNNSFYQLYALLFGVLIVRVSSKPGGWLESAPLKFLGRVSYGIYLLHHFVIFFIFREISFISGMPGPWCELTVFVLASLLSVLIAALSYQLLESPFLKKVRIKPQLSRG